MVPSPCPSFSGNPEASLVVAQNTTTPSSSDKVAPPDDDQFDFSEDAGNIPNSAPEESAAPPDLSVNLPDVVLHAFYQERQKEEETPTPKFPDSDFRLEQAANLAMVERFTGPLSQKRRQYLQKNRFLLIPFEECPATRSKNMLEVLAQIGEGQTYGGSPAANALFVGPDPFLHALHRYLASRLGYLEQTRLSLSLVHMLEGLYDNADRMRKAAGPTSAKSFQRLQAQFLLPLAILQSALPGGEGGASTHEQLLQENQAKEFGTSLPGSRERVLELIRTYDIAEEDTVALETEIASIFTSDATMPSALYSRHYSEAHSIDYSLFVPGGRHENLPVLRSWHRAMQWLQTMRWNLEREAGIMDAVNFALLMSMTPEPESGTLSDTPLRPPYEYWWELMEITSFFHGFANEGAYPEWAFYLREHVRLANPSPDITSSKVLLERIKKGLHAIKPFNPFFAFAQRSMPPKELRIFPLRFNLPEFLQKELTHYPDQERANLPDVYSTLWAAAVMGSSYALELLPPQISACLRPQPVQTPFHRGDQELGQASWTPSPAVPGTEGDKDKAIADMRVGIARLGLLHTESPESWTASLDSAWLYLSRALTQTYGKGTPLYMQSPMFRAKQLESFLASFTERMEDSFLLDGDVAPAQTTYSPLPESYLDKAVPQGFVEPNPAFWHGMEKLAKSVDALFESHGLLPEDRISGGILDTFMNQLDLCAGIAKKELLGQKVTQQEYAYLRDGMDLSPMAMPVEDAAPSPPAHTGETLRLLQNTDSHMLYGATARPQIMLVLTGDAQNPRITVGVAYNHQEFVVGPQKWLSYSQWRQWNAAAENGQQDMPPLPAKPFWYDGLKTQ